LPSGQNSGFPGDTVPVTITGTNLAPATQTSPPTTISFNRTGVTGAPNTVTSTQISATFTIDPAAATGAYNFWVTANGLGSNQQTFTVLSAGGPQLTSMAPDALLRSANATPRTTTVKITGLNLLTVNGIAIQTPTAGLSVGNLQVQSDTEISADITIAQSVAAGQNGVYVTNAAGQQSGPFQFTIAAPPSDVPPRIDTPLSFDPIILYTNVGNVNVTGAGFTNATFFLDDLFNPFQGVNVISDGSVIISLPAYGQAGFHSLWASNSAGISNVATFAVYNPALAPAFWTVSTTPSPLITGGPNATVDITVAGTGQFIQSNGSSPNDRTVVKVAGNNRVTNDMGPGHIQAKLIASDLIAVGPLTLTVVNPLPGGGSATTQVMVNYPTPSVASVAPDAVPTGSQAFTLTINGSNFVTGTQGAKVQVNGGAPRAPQTLTATAITIQIQAADIPASGHVAINVVNPTPSANPLSNEKDITVNPPGTCSWVSTYSGDGNYAYLDGNGTGAEWASPTGAVVAKDPASGNRCLFVCDTDNQRIRMIYLEGQTPGQSVTIAGNGVAGWDSGGVPATAHKLNGPRGITALTDQATGNVRVLYISDYGNNSIRELIPEQPYGNSNWLLGQFCGNTIAGWLDADFDTSEFNGPKGIFFGWDDCVYVADSANGAIRKIDGSGNSSSILHNTAWHTLGVTGSQSRGLIYLSERNTQAIYSFTTAGGSQTQLVGGFANPWELCLANNSHDGDVLYIPNMVACQITKLVLSTNTVSAYAGTGSYGFQDGDCASPAMFAYPKAVCTGIAGELYVTDMFNNRIRKIQ
jgi:hypothetical protein